MNTQKSFRELTKNLSVLLKSRLLGKRPMSSMSTTVVTDDDGRVVAVAGASGGTKIITAVAQVKIYQGFVS